MVSLKKNIAKKRILKELYFGGVLSCAELSLKTHKSLPLTTKLINELITEGFIAETGLAASTGGRRPQTFSLAQDVMYVVSVAMDQLVTSIAIMDMQHQFVSPITNVALPLVNNEEALAVLIENINAVIDKCAIPRKKIEGIGIAMPGFVNTKKGINNSFMVTAGGSITKLISDKTGIPVFIDNDSSLIALTELRFGAARFKKNAMVINIGWGVGLGMILNGELYRGNDGYAGEFSHIPLFSNNRICSCGKYGCLETETSLVRLVQKAKEGLQSGPSTRLANMPFDNYEKASEIITDAARAGDPFAVNLFAEIGYNIGKGVAVLIHLLNPELVILSGRGSAAGKILQVPIQQALNEHSIPILAKNTTVAVSKLGAQAELIGAAALVMEQSVSSLIVEKNEADKKTIFLEKTNINIHPAMVAN